MRAHTPTSLFLALVHLWLQTARHNFHSQVLGMVLDLHLPEDWDMGADPFRKLRDSQVPVLDPVTLLVERHAGNSDNSREGLCHCREGLTQRSRGEVVGVGTGGSLQEPRSVRFQRQNNRHEPPVDRVESHGEQVATHPAALAYTFHHRELPAKRQHAQRRSWSRCSYHGGNAIELAGRRPALIPGRSVCGPRLGTHRKIGKKNSGASGITGPKSDSRRVNFQKMLSVMIRWVTHLCKG